MNSRRLPRLWLGLLISLMAAVTLLPLAAGAQGTNQVVINYLQAIDAPDKFGVTLRTYFTLTDATGAINSTAQVSGAKYVLDAADGGTYDAKVSKASDPISVVLVLDFSGTMYNQYLNVEKGAISLVNSLPQDSNFAVIRYSDKVETVQDLTKDKNKVVNTLGTMKPPSGLTCLFDAVYQGVQLISNAPPGRRAVVVLTGNRDMTYGNKPCSTKTVQDVANAAVAPNSRTPIYTMGLQSIYQPIAEADLAKMADASGGIASLGKEPLGLFNSAVNALNAQQVAEALVSPRQGDRNFSLRVALSGGSNPNDVPARFTSPADYSVKPTATPTITPTPLPVAVTINSVQQDLKSKQFVVDLSVVSADQVAEYRFDLLNSNGTLRSQMTKPAPLNGPVLIPFESLEAGQYSIRAFAIGKDQQILARSEPYEVKWEPTPTPSLTPSMTPVPFGISVASVKYADETKKDSLLVNLNITQIDQVSRLHVVLTDAKTGVATKEYDPPKVSPALTLDLSGVPAADYSVDVTAFAANGQQLGAASGKFTYDFVTPTPEPTATPVEHTFIGDLTDAIKDPGRAPVVLGIFGVIILGIVLLMVVLILRRPKKAATGTGFLREMTGAVDVHQLAGYQEQQAKDAARGPAARGPAARGPAPKPSSAAAVAPTRYGMDADRTDAVSVAKMPPSSLTIERSRDTTHVGKTISITHVPFTMGRRERDLNFEGDGGVSREHAQITFENNVFYLTDNGSTNHSFIDEVECPAGVPKPLYDGCTIRLGTSTIIKFQTEQAASFDMDKTSPEPFKFK